MRKFRTNLAENFLEERRVSFLFFFSLFSKCKQLATATESYNFVIQHLKKSLLTLYSTMTCKKLFLGIFPSDVTIFSRGHGGP